MNFRLRLGQIWFVTSAEEVISSARGLHKNAHFFPNFFKHRILHFSDFQLHFSTTNMYAYVLCITVPPSLTFFPLIDGRVRSRAVSALAG